MPRCFSISIQSLVAWRDALRAFTEPAIWIAPENSNSFSVSVVLPASGCEMMANVRRRAVSCPVEVIEQWERTFGRPLNEGYGLSETSPVTHSTPQLAFRRMGSIGLPFPDTDMKIVDVETGRHELPIGEAGELCIAGPQVMKGYWQRPEETAKVMTKDGALKTGDVGVMDERGYVRIVDRKKDMILVSGFNVFPNELEQVVAMMPGVLEVAAIGVPDEHSGEVPKLFIVKKDPGLTEADVLKHCHEQLTGYKRPKYVEFRAELPKTNVGKILRRALRDEKPGEKKAA